MAPRSTPERQGLYRLKPASQRVVDPLADALVRGGVAPDAISATAVTVAAAGGTCLALSPIAPGLLLAVPAAAAARLVLNLLDGMVARRADRARPMGEVWNELADRGGDVLFIGGLGFIPAVGPWLALSAVIAALLASYGGIAARAAGGRRQYGGVMSKPGRMFVLAVAAPVAFLTDDPAWLATAAAVLLLGSLLTLLQRLWAAAADLGRPGDAA